jgi:transposase
VGRPGGPGRRGYPAELRRRVVDLLATGRKVADVARDLGVSEQAISGWRRQEQIDRGREPGVSTGEKAELAVHRRAAELLKESTDPKGGSRPAA